MSGFYDILATGSIQNFFNTLFYYKKRHIISLNYIYYVFLQGITKLFTIPDDEAFMFLNLDNQHL